MKTNINIFIPYNEALKDCFIKELERNTLIKNIFLITTENIDLPYSKCKVLNLESMVSSKALCVFAEKSDEEYSVIITEEANIDLGYFSLERFEYVASSVGAGIVYSNYFDVENKKRKNHPVIEYQEGSLRDDFNFGPILFVRSSALKKASKNVNQDYKYAALYAMRLYISKDWNIEHIDEYLYSQSKIDSRSTGKKIFDYVNPANRSVQLEMEIAVTNHLKNIGAWLEPTFNTVDFDENIFPVEASVIIPVRNRKKTIEDAIRSVMSQKANFKFNLIVVDNHSTDGTTKIIKRLAGEFNNIIHLIPQRDDLGIGGCWNLGVQHELCGKFAIQLDSDDVYSKDGRTLQKIVDVFYSEKAAMVVGSYIVTDSNLNEIAPGLIDHKEWTPENGRNNALRINGLGAPRAFYTPILREIKIPNVNYGEDYGLGLSISRHYQIGRVYDPIYLVRRWEENSDASLSIEQMNKHNVYKDRLRTYEVKARKRMMNKKY